MKEEERQGALRASREYFTRKTYKIITKTWKIS